MTWTKTYQKHNDDDGGDSNDGHDDRDGNDEDDDADDESGRGDDDDADDEYAGERLASYPFLQPFNPDRAAQIESAATRAKHQQG